MGAPPRRGRPAVAEESDDGGLARFLSEHRAGLGALVVIVAAACAGWAAWSRVSDPARSHPDMLLPPDAVELRGVAPWVRSDLKTEALRNASLDGGLPLDDPELSRRLARAFEMHPWVRLVVGVALRHPAAATVEVECREPVAMVGVKGGLLAIDADGVVLPSADFTPESAALYPRLAGIDSSPQGPEGTPWGDPLVEEGAAVAAAVGPEWKTLGFTECRPVGKHGQSRWELVGPPPRVILFGSAPGREPEGEPSAAAKIARLQTLAGDSTESLDLTRPDPDEDAAADQGSRGSRVPSIPSP
ncbi:MAG: hypothetical protein ACKO6B_03150 [Planctomycetia bacterium]